ncbi:MAG: TMEM175 family protein [Gemmatimonadota bacterium]|nr:TMEM175 family protein [Gemmatimonadota bacterium]
MTLLVVSLEVPKNFAELRHSVAGFLPFAISFSILVWIWYNQHIFFRRYGLQDAYSIFLNVTLLFVILFYIYPLKFLFGLLISTFSGAAVAMTFPDGSPGFGISTGSSPAEPVIAFNDLPTLMAIYAAGFIAIWTVFALLHLHAYRKRALLELTPLEAFDTLTAVREDSLLAGIGVVSLLFALTRVAPAGVSGWIYITIGPILWIHGIIARNQRRRLLATENADSRAP